MGKIESMLESSREGVRYMRPSSQIPQRTVRFGDFQADFATGELRKNGHRVKVQDQPLKVLAVLLSRSGALVTREEFREALWSDETFVDFDRGLNTAVNRLRAALGDSAENPRFVETVGRRGYRFIGSIAVAEPDQPSVSTSKLTLEKARPSFELDQEGQLDVPQLATSASVHTTEASLSPRTRRKWFGTAISMLVTVSVALGWMLYYGWHRPRLHNRMNLGDERITRLTNSGGIESVAVSPNGACIVYSQRDVKGSGLWLHHVQSRSAIQILPSEEVDFRGLSFSSDGNSVYFVQTRKETGTFKDLYVMPILGGIAQLLTRDIDSPVSFSPDGNRFDYTRGFPDGNEIRVANADGTQDRLLSKITDTQPNFQPGATWSPDGQTIVVSLMIWGKQTDYALDAISTSDGSVREVIRSKGVIGRPLWAPDSHSVLVVIDDVTGRGQLWSVSIPQGERQRLTTDLANWGIVIDATRDARTVAAVQWALSANIWEAPGSNPTDAHQITFGEVQIVAARSLFGQTLVVSADGRLWMLGEGRQRLPFSNLRDVGPPVSCGRFVVVPTYQTQNEKPADTSAITSTKLASGRVVVLRSYQSGPARIMKLDSDGLNATELTNGPVYSPTCDPDGQFLFYISMKTPQRIVRLSLRNRDLVVLGAVPGPSIRGAMTTSPDGRFLAFPYDAIDSSPRPRLGIVSINSGKLVRSFEAPMGIYRESCVRWSPDGKALHYLLTKGDVTNIWEQPLSGSSAHQLTQFTSGKIFDFNWSADGKTILMSRGNLGGDVVLLSDSN
jgi:Tol biopolymer transport system component/DNA-binding winged helix-turn-helix (wHTH) protein